MELSIRSVGSSVVVDIRGDLDRHTCRGLATVLEPLLEDETPRIVLNCAEMGMIDSTGIGVLVTGYKGAAAFGGALRLAAPTDAVRKVLEVTGLATLIGTYESLEDACG